MKSVYLRTLIILVVFVSVSGAFAFSEMKEVNLSSAVEFSLRSSLPQDVNVFKNDGVIIIADYVTGEEVLTFSEEPVDLSLRAEEDNVSMIRPQSEEIMDYFRSIEAVEKCL